ncbi:hypothetical protein EYF80_010383 [Liparis tanakae]|uniref:Uncharacterized protein n=1 Tax=Liparis tanakae TaxID=230148 RepID=A0A4Z2IMX2_9TELE|nr:hypothetical protein EYF80_010383 [Liparis tanakae]
METLLLFVQQLQAESLYAAGDPPLWQQAAGVTDQFIQEGNDIGEFGPMTPLLLPAVQHQLVQGHGAAHWCRQPVALLNRENHLERQSQAMKDAV